MILKDFINHPFSMWHIKEHLGAASLYEYIQKRFFPKQPALMALSLICRDGYDDRMMFRSRVFKQAIGVDELDVELHLAEKAARAENIPIRYIRTPLNSALLSGVEERYPLIYSTHLGVAREVEQVLERAHKLLLPDGVFVFWGYCGPQRPSAQDHTYQICNRLLKCLPDHIKDGYRIIDQEILDKLMNLPGSDNRSSEMISNTIKYVFRDVEEICLGTTITHPILGPILSNFSSNNDSEISLLLLLQVMEQIMIKHKIIHSNMKMIIGRP